MLQSSEECGEENRTGEKVHHCEKKVEIFTRNILYKRETKREKH